MNKIFKKLFWIIIIAAFRASVFADTAVPPAAISNLTALPHDTQEGAVTLKWTAPGEDDLTGTVENYSLKFATYQILSVQFDGTPDYFHGWSAFAAGNSQEEQVVTGLTPGVTYYFAVKGCDSLSNYGIWNSIIDVAEANTLNSTFAQILPPGPITDLYADITGFDEGKVNLSWSAPGDDGYLNTLGSGSDFLIQSSTNPDEAWAPLSAQLTVSTSSIIPGNKQLKTIATLIPGTTYYFRVWTKDENPDCFSPLSNQATAWIQTDISPPTAITRIDTFDNGFKHVKLRWIAPCEDNNSVPYNTGISTISYEIKYATFQITSEVLYNSATVFLVISSSITQPGNFETFTVTGLTNGVTYYFSIKSADETGAWSVISSSSPKSLVFNSLPNPASLDITNLQRYISVSSHTIRWSGADAGGNLGNYDSSFGDSISSYTVYFSTYYTSQTTIGRSTVTFNGIINISTVTSRLSENATYWMVVYTYDTESGCGFSTLNSAWHWLTVNTVNDAPNNFNLYASSGIANFKDYSPYNEKLRFRWNATTDPDGPADFVAEYRLYYSISQNFETNITTGITGITASSYTITHSLQDNTTYYWFVVARDSGNPFNYAVKSTSSSVWSVIVNCVNSVPGNFLLLTPASSTVVNNTRTPLFTWNASIDPDPGDSIYEYKLFYSSWTQNFSSTQTLAGQSELSCGVETSTRTPVLVENATYYWCVAAYDNAQTLSQLYSAPPYFIQESTKSITRYFVINSENEPPNAFSLYSPIGSTNPAVTSEMVFDWADTIDPDPFDQVHHYALYFSQDPNFSVALTTWTPFLYNSSVTVNYPFSPGVNYYWNVGAYDAAGNCRVSASTGVFIIAQNAPQSFTIITPTGSVRNLLPRFDWNNAVETDPYDDISYYRLYYSTSLNFESGITTWTGNIPVSSYTFTALNTLTLRTTYYWNVRAYDSTGLFSVSNTTGVFFTSNRAPGDFDLIYATGNSVITSNRPVLTWQPSVDIDNEIIVYTLSYSTFSNFSSSNVFTITNLNSYTVASNLSENTTYYWKVVSRDVFESKHSLSTGVFIVNAVAEQPTAFELTASSGILNISTPTFSWTQSYENDPGDYIAYYTLYYSSSNFLVTQATTGLKTASFIPSQALQENITYKWFVTATDSNGLTTASNSTWTITINAVDEYPDSFNLVSSTGWVSSRRPSFVWNRADKTEWWDTTVYKLECGNLANQLDLITRTGITITTYTIDVDLQENATYWWRIIATDSANHSTTSNQIFYIFVSSVNDAPGNFGLTEPADGSVINTRTPVFLWEKPTDPDEPKGDRIAYYNIYYATTPVFTTQNIIINLTTNTFTLPEVSRLLQNTTFYWKVAAYDMQGSSTVSPFYSFFVANLKILKTPEYFTSTVLNEDGLSLVLAWPAMTQYTDDSIADDLAGYNVYRSINPLEGYVLFAFTKDNYYMDTTVNNSVYYYFIRSVSVTGIEGSDSPIVSSEAQNKTISTTENKDAYLELSNSMMNTMKSRNTLPTITKTNNIYEIKVTRTDTGETIENYKFTETITLNFVITADASSRKTVQSYNSKYAIYWHNGIEYINIGGETDDAGTKIYVNAIYSGKYKLMSIIDSDFSYSVEPRKIITPNSRGSAVTETFKIRYVNNTGEQVSAEIFDLTGAFVARMHQHDNQGEYLEWDGRQATGEYSKKGVYLYQIKAGSRLYSGTVIIAR